MDTGWYEFVTRTELEGDNPTLSERRYLVAALRQHDDHVSVISNEFLRGEICLLVSGSTTELRTTDKKDEHR